MAISKESVFFILLSGFAAVSLAGPTDCFVPNGTDRNDGSDVKANSIAYTPCDQRAPFSMCCRYGADDCLDNGLCQGYGADGSRPIWRESCTDPTWTSPYCLKLCVRGQTTTGFDYEDGDVTVHECADGGFCCGQNNDTCCGTSEAQYIVNGQVTNVDPKSTTTSSSSSSSSTSSSTPAPIGQGSPAPPTPQSNTDGGTNIGAIAGGVIGGVVALAIIAAAIWFFKGRRKHQVPDAQQQPHHAQDAYYPPPKSPAPPQYHVQPGLHEVQGGSDGLDTSQLDGQEKYEIGHQKRDRMGRQELE
ncbi:MAG: hypothetical protein L6R36_002282 [Xanthoria steineri]|nr:MAG: hypothetical protein L6R36_002282 [Xanthoria steineri]